MKTSAAMALALLVATPLSGALGPRYGGRVVVALPRLPDGDPARWRAPEERLLSALTQEALFATAADGVPREGLVLRTDVAAGGREWTLTLRPDARFHDGSPVRPEDVAQSLVRFLRTPSSVAAGSLAGRLEGGSSVRAGEAATLAGVRATEGAVVLRFATPEHELRALESPAAAIRGAAGVAAGPFVVTSRAAGRLVLTAFGAHVRGRPLLDEVVVSGDGAPSADLAPAWGGARAPAATLILVLPRTGVLGTLELRLRVAEAVRAANVPRFVAAAETARALLTPPVLSGPLPTFPADLPPAETASRAVVLHVAPDVPPAASQRVLATLNAFGLQADVSVMAPGTTGPPAGIRLLAFAPEVHDPALAIEELALLAGGPAEVLQALSGARTVPPGAERLAALARVERQLRQAALLLPVAWLPASPGARPHVHGVWLRGATPILEDAWVEP